MKSYNDTVKRDAERAMKRLPQYREIRDEQTALNYELAYVLAHAARATDVVAVAQCEDQYISFQPCTDASATELWAFDIDRDLLDELVKGYRIAYMHPAIHAEVWALISYNQEHNLPLPDGANKYLGYCKHNGVTRSKLQKAVGYEGMNVLPLYDPKADKQKNTNAPNR